MIVFRPGSELFQPAALLALISAMSYALYQVMTRMLADSDSVATTTLYSALVGLVITGALAPLNLQPIAPNHIHHCFALGASGDFRPRSDYHCLYHCPCFAGYGLSAIPACSGVHSSV